MGSKIFGSSAFVIGRNPVPLTRSAELYERALGVMPGGVNSPVRAMRSIGRDPIFIASGEGAELVDVDGGRYIDYVCSWGPLIHGHAHPAIVGAVAEAARRGTSYGAPTEAEVELAAEIVARVPSAELVRMTSSGTEATMTAVRLARAVTGRELILKFAGAYHGHVDGLLVAGGSGLATLGVPASPGVPEAQAAATVVIPWNDPYGLKGAVDEHGARLAAVIAEPICANMGVVEPEPGFLEELRAQTEACGALLIFDEVITGFRIGPGGAQERFGVTPDLTVLGKVVGGGLPAAAAAGKRMQMQRLAPAGDVYQAGTLSGNPLAVAAGLAALKLLDLDAYDRLRATTDKLAEGLREAAADAGAPVTVNSACGLLTVFFSPGPVFDYEGAAASDTDAYAAFCRAMLERGIYPPASQFEAWFPSLVHTSEHVERTVAAAREAFAEAVATGYTGERG